MVGRLQVRFLSFSDPAYTRYDIIDGSLRAIK